MTLHALILDDNPWNMEALRACKSDHSEYHFVGDAQQALYVLYEFDIEHEVAVIACNVNLISSDAFAFLQPLNQDFNLSGLPVICYSVSSDVNASALETVLEALGADELIVCNWFDAKAICAEIDNWLTRHRFIPPPFYGLDDFASPS